MRALALLAASLLAAPALAGAGDAAPATTPVLGLPAQVVRHPASSSAATRPVYDARGRQVGSRQWLQTDAGGNCCETLVITTPEGRIVEFGGTYLVFSDDEGSTWSEVRPPTPLLGGEGSVVRAPNGDVVAVSWDPYSGDHLQAITYSAATKQWRWAEQPLHSPFFDREWVSVVQGPLTVTGRTVPWAYLLTGGAFARDVRHLSVDGLHYEQVSSPLVETAAAPAVAPGPVRVATAAAADWWKVPAEASSTTLTGGGLIAADRALAGCIARIVPPSSTFRCDRSGLAEGTLVQDSRGWLLRVGADGPDEALAELSTDGGASWQETALPLPPGATAFEGVDRAAGRAALFHDVAVNGRLGMAAVATRVLVPGEGGSTAQDVVYVLDLSTPVPRVAEVLLVGVGGLSTVVGIVAGETEEAPRLDFHTVAILPSGRVVTGYFDTTSREPSLAVERGAGRDFT